MTFQPVVPFSGNAGWAFLQRTRETQQQTFNNSSRMTRNVDHFRETIATIKSAEDLVKDRRLLEVALGAFGLDDDINNKFFIQKILESDTTSSQSLANKLTDKRYLAMSEAFGFGNVFGPRTGFNNFDTTMINSYRNRQFEVAVGEQVPSMRLALGLARDLAAIAERSIADDAKWFTVMATKPVRTVLEQALSMPSSIGALDLDRQLKEFRARSDQFFGISEVSNFNTPEMIELLTSRFLIRDQALNGLNGYSSQSAALAILQSGPRF